MFVDKKIQSAVNEKYFLKTGIASHTMRSCLYSVPSILTQVMECMLVCMGFCSIPANVSPLSTSFQQNVFIGPHSTWLNGVVSQTSPIDIWWVFAKDLVMFLKFFNYSWKRNAWHRTSCSTCALTVQFCENRPDNGPYKWCLGSKFLGGYNSLNN